MQDNAQLRRYEHDIYIVTGNATAISRTTSGGKTLVVLARPDGRMAVRAEPANIDPVIDYLRDLFGEQTDPMCKPAHHRHACALGISRNTYNTGHLAQREAE